MVFEEREEGRGYTQPDMVQMAVRKDMRIAGDGSVIRTILNIRRTRKRLTNSIRPFLRREETVT